MKAESTLRQTPAMGPTPRKLTFLYDSHCGVCTGFRDWLLGQPRHLETEFLAYDHPHAMQVARGIPPAALQREIHVVADTGDVWVGGDAWLLALWSTVAYRTLASRLAGPTFRPAAKKIALAIAANRHRISGILGLESSAQLHAITNAPLPKCPDSGTCKL